MLNGLWITVERDPAKAGGLGEVSKTIPAEMNCQLPDIDLRVIVPGLRPILQEPGWAYSTAQLWVDKTYCFRVAWRFEADTQTWVYALCNERWFGQYPHLYFRGHDEPTLGNDPIFTANMLFCRAAAQLVEQLEVQPTSLLKEELPWFDGPLNFALGHDWLSGPVLGLLPKKVGKLFMLHNTYDEQRSPEQGQQALGLPERPEPNVYQQFSPLEFGLYNADVVIANQNYVRSLVQKDTLDFLVKNLWDKMASGTLYDMHHGVSERYDARTSDALQTDGFTRLKPANLITTGLDAAWQSAQRLLPKDLRSKESTLQSWRYAALSHYKAQNKEALQRLFNLTPNPEAMLMGWVGRFDPLQKGFYLVMNEVQPLLDEHPDLQLIIAGSNSNDDETVANFIESVNATPEYRGRVYLEDNFIDRQRVIRICAGADFLLMPSLYEPFGLAQLEAMKLGCIPIVHGVDGLRSTVSDPWVDKHEHHSGPREKVADYGQVGVKIEQLNVPLYHQAISAQVDGRKLTQQEQWVLNDSQSKVKLALSRAIRLMQSPDERFKVTQNGLTFVNEQHTWRAIIRRYREPLHHAVDFSRQRESANEPHWYAKQ